MIYLLYGSDFQASLKKLNEIIEEYRKKNGDLNIHKFDAEEDGFAKIKTVLQTNSLFSEKKLAVIRHVSGSEHKEALLEMFSARGGSALGGKDLRSLKDIVVILWERELGAKELAELKEHCDKVQEFSARGGPASGGKEATVFHLGDSFFSSPRAGIKTLLELLHQGHDDFSLFAYLSNHARTLLTVKSYAEKNLPVPSSHGIHPFVVKKTSALVRPMAQEYLRKHVRRFFEEDIKIKTGLSKPKESLLNILTGIK